MKLKQSLDSKNVYIWGIEAAIVSFAWLKS